MSSSSLSKCPILDPAGCAMHTEAAGLRAQGPAVLVELPGPVHAWSVTRHSVIQALTGDPRVSRDPRRHWPGLADAPEGWSLAPIVMQQNFFNAYGEEHRKLRRRVAPSFSPRRVEQMRPRVQATTDRLIEALSALPPGATADVRQALALPLTMTVICDLFGVPDHLREKLGAAIDAVLDPSVDPQRALAIQSDLHNRLREVLQHKREHPAADLTSDLLLLAEPDEDPIPDHVLLDTLFLMIGAGCETAVNLITSAVQALLSHPENLTGVLEEADDVRVVIVDSAVPDFFVAHADLRHRPFPTTGAARRPQPVPGAVRPLSRTADGHDRASGRGRPGRRSGVRAGSGHAFRGAGQGRTGPARGPARPLPGIRRHPGGGAARGAISRT